MDSAKEETETSKMDAFVANPVNARERQGHSSDSDEDTPLQMLRQKFHDNEDSKPLSTVQQQIRERGVTSSNVNESMSVSPEDSDDSVKDPTFKVKKKELEQSGSSDDEIQTKGKRKSKKKRVCIITNNQTHRAKEAKTVKKDQPCSKNAGLKKKWGTHSGGKGIKLKLQPKTVSGDKNWKRKQSTFNRKRFIQGRPRTPKQNTKPIFAKVEANTLSQAKNLSCASFKVRQCLNNLHVRNLDALLNSNGLQRKKIFGDGNCFFTALMNNNGIKEEALSLRKNICDHIRDNKELYIGFLKKKETCAEESFNNQLEILRQNGSWSVDLGDILPLAVANYTDREIIIYTSKRSNPIISVKPSSTADNDIGPPITIAYIATPGFEHYDSCELLGTDKNKRETSDGKVLPEHAAGIPAVAETRQDKSSNKNSGNMSPSVTPMKQTKRSDSNVSPTITPRKQACFQSPKKKAPSRKRKANPSVWKKNVRKNLRLSGKEYLSVTGKVIKAKEVKMSSCSKCRYKCAENVNEQQRQEIFSVYWNLKDRDRQMDYICNHVEEKNPDRIKQSAKTRRHVSRFFYLSLTEGKVRVCKNFFSKTLAVKDKTIETAMKNKKGGVYSPTSRKRVPPNKTPTHLVDAVKKHIESCPLVDAHYTRKDTNRKFLGQDLNITKMYNLYRDECKEKGVPAVGTVTYRRIFCNDYNFSFHIPKKDQCQTCATHEQEKQKGVVTEQVQKQYDAHIERKQKARNKKMQDKIRSKGDKTFHAATFDLEAVLSVPCSLVSQVYYKRKLSCYNLSLYSLGDSKASCFLWNETDGKRGSCEIGTCLILYLKSLPSNINHVCFYSDSCTGQNRNRFIATALLHAVATLPHISVIDHKYLESGHTQMECDSMHAAIETAKKNTSVFVPSQWDTIVRMARRKSPYTVIPLKYYDILNFKPISEKILPQAAVDEEGKKVMWMKICWLQFNKNAENVLSFKYNIDENFHTIRLKSSRVGKSSVKADISFCYKEKLPISADKKKDLISLCNSNVIPEDFHGFYEKLPTSSKVTNRLPDPDVLESDQDSDNE